MVLAELRSGDRQKLWAVIEGVTLLGTAVWIAMSLINTDSLLCMLTREHSTSRDPWGYGNKAFLRALAIALPVIAFLPWSKTSKYYAYICDEGIGQTDGSISTFVAWNQIGGYTMQLIRYNGSVRLVEPVFYDVNRMEVLRPIVPPVPISQSDAEARAAFWQYVIARIDNKTRVI